MSADIGSVGQVITVAKVVVITSMWHAGLNYQNSSTKPTSVGNGFSLL